MTEHDTLAEVSGLLSQCHQRLRHGEGVSANTAAGVLEQGWAGCGGFSLVFASSAARAGLATRLVGFRYGTGEGDTHVFVEVLVGGTWMLCDPTANCYIPGTSFADVLTDPALSERVVRQSLPPENAWMYRYFTAEYLAAVSDVWISNGPSGFARQWFTRDEYLRLLGPINAACERYPNRAVAVVRGGMTHALRTAGHLLKYRRRIAVAGAHPAFVLLGRLAALIP